MKTLSSLSVVLPALNEEGNIESLLSSLLEFLPVMVSNFEILVVDDGSRDQTADKVRQMCVTDSRIRLLTHEKTKGFGGALATGFKNASKEWIFYTDSDLQFDIREFKKFLPLLEKNRVFTGYRAKRQDPWPRILLSWIYTRFFVRLFFGVDVRDLNCGFKLYPKEFFDGWEPLTRGGLVHLELYCRAKRLGFQIIETSVTHYPRVSGKPTGGSITVIGRALLEAWRFRKQLRLGTPSTIPEQPPHGKSEPPSRPRQRGGVNLPV